MQEVSSARKLDRVEERTEFKKYADSCRPERNSFQPHSNSVEVSKVKPVRFSDSERHLKSTCEPRNDRMQSKVKETQRGLQSDIANIKKITCRNEELEGKRHPETQVPFLRRIIDVNGQKIEGVFPVFKSKFNARLLESMYKASDRVQFKECNSQLKERVELNSRLKSNFNTQQLEQIRNGDTPDGYTWHHDAEAGKMQLVSTDVHQRTGHTGGRTIWGGGNENR